MLSQGFIFVAVFLDFESFGKGTLQVAQIVYVCKVSHNFFIYSIIAVSYTHLSARAVKTTMYILMF